MRRSGSVRDSMFSNRGRSQIRSEKGIVRPGDRYGDAGMNDCAMAF